MTASTEIFPSFKSQHCTRQNIKHFLHFREIEPLAWLVLAVCIGCTLLAWHFTQRETEQNADLRFQSAVQEAHNAIGQRMEGYINVLLGAAALFNTSENISRAQWRAYVAALKLGTYAPDIQGISYAQRLFLAEKTAHTATLRADGFPAYDIKPEGVRAQYAPIIYIEPFAGSNQQLIGVDLFSEPIRRAAMEAARDTGNPTVSGRVFLIEDETGGAAPVQPGFIIFVPVFTPGALLETVAQRRHALRGFISSAFRMSELMGGILGNRRDFFYLRVFDGHTALLFDMQKTARGAQPRYSQSVNLVLPGRSWRLELYSQPDFEQTLMSYLPSAVAFGGALIDLLLFLIIAVLLKHRKTDHEALSRLERMLEGAIDSIDEAFVIYDENDCLAYCNERYREVYAASADLFIPGTRFEQIIRSGAERGQYVEAQGRIDDWVRERIALHQAANTTLIQQLENGRWLRIIERKTRDGYTVGFRFDITQLKIAQENAEAANSAKSRFLANMSHEIRTPINAVLGFTFLALKQNLSPSAREYLLNIQTASESLLFLVNDILDFSKIDAGKLELEKIPFALDDVLQRAIKLFAPSAAQKSVKLRIRSLPSQAERWLGDPQRLGQVLINLISNALKFTERGEISLTVDVLARSAEGATLHFSVRDSGLGISPEQQATLFNAFTQADSSTTRKYGGTGLGLALSQQLVACMGGEIGVESVLGAGSCFSFSVRFACAADAPATAMPPAEAPIALPCLEGTRILVVEDNDFNRQVALALIELTGATVHTADEGVQAVAAVAAGGIDLVLMDIQMPVMDGYDATRAIRLDWPQLPIIALTAHALSEEKPRVLAAGMNDILTKPILPALLYATLAHWLAGKAQTAAQKPDLALPPTPETRVALALESSVHESPLNPALEALAAPSPEVFDQAAALGRVNGDHKMLDRFLRLFRERNADIVDKISAALALEDWHPARQLTHALKGGAGTVGLIELSAVAARLEATLAQAVQGTDTPAQRRADFLALEVAWTRAQQTLAALLDPVPEAVVSATAEMSTPPESRASA